MPAHVLIVAGVVLLAFPAGAHAQTAPPTLTASGTALGRPGAGESPQRDVDPRGGRGRRGRGAAARRRRRPHPCHRPGGGRGPDAAARCSRSPTRPRRRTTRSTARSGTFPNGRYCGQVRRTRTVVRNGVRRRVSAGTRRRVPRFRRRSSPASSSPTRSAVVGSDYQVRMPADAAGWDGSSRTTGTRAGVPGDGRSAGGCVHDPTSHPPDPGIGEIPPSTTRSPPRAGGDRVSGVHPMPASPSAVGSAAWTKRVAPASDRGSERRSCGAERRAARRRATAAATVAAPAAASDGELGDDRPAPDRAEDAQHPPSAPTRSARPRRPEPSGGARAADAVVGDPDHQPALGRVTVTEHR